MKLANKKGKLTITVGPASDNYETLKSLILAGATTTRFNFSHGGGEEHGKKFVLVKQLREELNIPISMMLDTKGPEIRVGKMTDGAQKIEVGDTLKIWTTAEKYSNFLGTSKELTVSYNMAQDLHVGDTVLFDDGKLSSQVIEVAADYVVVKTLNAHTLKTNKRINLPGVDFSLPFLSQKDIDDIKYGVENGANYIAASFVNSADNVNEIRALLKEFGGEHVKIISKIESAVGIKNLDSIIEASDGIMVARGDLGLEIPYYEVPFNQKEMIRKCRLAGKPVIVATQMLDSMENVPQPTRAEVSDVYLATALGADSTMLSGESANGKYPLQAVSVMARINEEAEKEVYSSVNYDAKLEELRKSSCKCHDAKFAFEIANRCRDSEYDYVVLLANSDKLIQQVSKFRPNAYVVPVVNDEKLIHAYGASANIWVAPNSLEIYDALSKDVNVAKEALKAYEVEKGAKVLVAVHNHLHELVM